MGNKKIIMLVGSILLGALAGFALLGYVRGVEDDVRDEVSRVPVYVVNGDIAQGTTAASAQQLGLIVQSETESSLRPATAVSDLTQIEGQIAASNLVANQVLVTGHFDDPSVVATTYADQIAPGYVAFSMTVQRDQAVNGFLSPGDFVDVIVLGDPPATVGEEDAFESSLAASPYERPARTLFRGVRIESVNDQTINDVATPDEEGVENEEANTGSLDITIAVPSGAAQRLLSVTPEDIVLTLLPPDWEPEEQVNEVIEAIITDEDLPGEDPNFITPYGAEGFVDLLAEEAAADEAAADPTEPGETVEEPVEEVEELEEEG